MAGGCKMSGKVARSTSMVLLYILAQSLAAELEAPPLQRLVGSTPAHVRSSMISANGRERLLALRGGKKKDYPRSKLRGVRKMQLPRVNMPKMQMPSVEMPKVTMPRLALPALAIPSVKVPSLKAPKFLSGDKKHS